MRLQINQVLDLYKKRTTEITPISGKKLAEAATKIIDKSLKKRRGRPKKVVVDKTLDDGLVDESSFLGANDEKLKEESRELAKKVGAKQHRPVYQDVEVVCDRCHKKEMVHPTLAPKKIGEDFARYICNKCNGGRR